MMLCISSVPGSRLARARVRFGACSEAFPIPMGFGIAGKAGVGREARPPPEERTLRHPHQTWWPESDTDDGYSSPKPWCALHGIEYSACSSSEERVDDPVVEGEAVLSFGTASHPQNRR